MYKVHFQYQQHQLITFEKEFEDDIRALVKGCLPNDGTNILNDPTKCDQFYSRVDTVVTLFCDTSLPTWEVDTTLGEYSVLDDTLWFRLNYNIEDIRLNITASIVIDYVEPSTIRQLTLNDLNLCV